MQAILPADACRNAKIAPRLDVLEQCGVQWVTMVVNHRQAREQVNTGCQLSK
jgi:hypothetical protein